MAFVLLYFLVLPKLSQQKGKLNLLTHINLAFVAASLVLEAASLVAYAMLTRSILSQFGKPPRLRRLVQVGMSTLALTRVLPGGSAAGTGLGYRLLTDMGYSQADAGLTLAVQSVGSAAVLNALLWVGLVASIPLRALHQSPGSGALPKTLYITAALFGALLVGVFGFVILSLTRGQERALRIVHAVTRRLRFLDEDSVVRMVQRVSDQLKVMVSNRSLLLRAVVWASANWLFDAAALWVMVAAFHYRLGPDALIVSYCIANIVAAIPITPGGLGVVEVVLTSALTAYGAPGQVAALGVIAYRLVSFWLPIPAGGIAYLTLRLDPQFRERQQQAEREREEEQGRKEGGLRTWAGEHGMKVGPSSEAEAGAEE
ncbi:MAG: hypothetical protein QOD49_3123 [Actinomycetota bacterium]|nr:hypothetical protein [Actinomycetota bacterium]